MLHHQQEKIELNETEIRILLKFGAKVVDGYFN